MSIRVSLRGMLRLIRIDTLRRVHNVGFLEGRLNYQRAQSVYQSRDCEFEPQLDPNLNDILQKQT